MLRERDVSFFRLRYVLRLYSTSEGCSDFPYDKVRVVSGEVVEYNRYHSRVLEVYIALVVRWTSIAVKIHL